MINRNKMSDYAHSMIFPKPNRWYGLNRRSVFNLIKFFRSISKSHYGLNSYSSVYYSRKYSLRARSYSWNEYDRTLDDLLTKEIVPFSWRNSDSYKALGLDSYSSICYGKKCKFMNPRNDVRIR
jgi:hypothetical protein